MKIFLRIILLSTLGFLLIFVISELYSKYERHGEIEDSFNWSDTIPKEYLHLLKLPDSCCKKQSDNIVFIKTSVSKYRNPVSKFYIDSKYYLQVYKMDTSFNYSLKNAVKESFSDAHFWFSTPYALDETTDMEFLFKLTKPIKPKNIFLDLYGDRTHVLIKNDTIAYYQTNCRNFSLKFNLQDKNDIYGECKSKSLSEAPLEIMFLKRNKKLYMLILSATNANTELKQGMLYGLFFK
jgi:hypothetical protein